MLSGQQLANNALSLLILGGFGYLIYSGLKNENAKEKIRNMFAGIRWNKK